MAYILTPETLQQKPALLLTLGITLLLVYYIHDYMRKNPTNPALPDLPWASPAKNGTLVESLLEATKKYPNQPFLLPTSSTPITVLPLTYLSHVKSLPDTTLSASAELIRRLHSAYTGVGGPSDSFTSSIKVEVSRTKTDYIVRIVQEEVEFAMGLYFADVDAKGGEWTEVAAYGKILMVIAALGARVSVGLPLCRDQVWLGSTISFAQSVLAAARAIDKITPRILRPLLVPRLPEVRALRTGYAYSAKKLLPQFEPIVADFKKSRRTTPLPPSKSPAEKYTTEDYTNGDYTAQECTVPEEDGQFNSLHWLLNHEPRPDKVDVMHMARLQMGFAFAAIHTSGLRGINEIFDLAAYPEVADVLREEYEAVARKEGCVDAEGRFTKVGLARLRKMDSFMLESARCSPSGITNFVRSVIDPNGLTLPNGEFLPRGTGICFPLLFSPYALNPPSDSPLVADGQPPLSEFHPFRFYELRKQHGSGDKWQFVSLGDSNMGFGAGVHACPGRFFAGHNLKIILVEMLKRYDLGLTNEGGGLKNGGERPKPVVGESFFSINPASKIWMRKRV